MERSAPIRREPPPFRTVEVRAVEPVTGWLASVTLGGPGLREMAPADPAASVRLLLPGRDGLTMPSWNGNEFLLPDGTRPAIRTLTPRRKEGGTLTVEVVLHPGGALAAWLAAAVPGGAVAVSGPGRGSAPAAGADAYLLAGDEAAVPAIAQLLEAMGPAPRIDVLIETAHPGDPAPLPARPDAEVTWVPAGAGATPGTALADAVEAASLPDGLRVWAAGEAAAMQRIRRHLRARGIPRGHATVRGYWKHGKAAGAAGDAVGSKTA
ncbi:MAG: siderophore-interacting protein [Actinobacteria bacterium]|nr:siderophore-interacting protein [Actinomycetota bacterium]